MVYPSKLILLKDGLVNTDNTISDGMANQISPSEFQLNKVKLSDTESPSLYLYLTILHECYTADCLVVNPFTDKNITAFFNCTPADRT